MFHIPQNYVQIGVQRVGGPTKTAHAIGVSNTTIHEWIRQQKISNIDYARKLAGLAGLEVQQLRPTR